MSVVADAVWRFGGFLHRRHRRASGCRCAPAWRPAHRRRRRVARQGPTRQAHNWLAALGRHPHATPLIDERAHTQLGVYSPLRRSRSRTHPLIAASNLPGPHTYRPNENPIVLTFTQFPSKYSRVRTFRARYCAAHSNWSRITRFRYGIFAQGVRVWRHHTFVCCPQGLCARRSR